MPTITKKLHHTCEDKKQGDVDRAPFISPNVNSYLGKGYYFWDDDLAFAKYWGYQWYLQNKLQYIVVEFQAEWDSAIYFDLAGEKSCMRFMTEAEKILRTRGPRRWHLSEIIETLKRENSRAGSPFFENFNYKVIRANDPDASSRQQVIMFSPDDDHQVDLNPCFLVCVIDMAAVVLANRTLAHSSKKP